MSNRTHDRMLGCRVPSELKDRLEQIHEQHRVPISELVRYLLESGLARYAPRDRPGQLDTDRLVVDVAEDMSDRQRLPSAPRRPRARTNAAA